MINTTKFLRLVAVLSLAFIILEINTTESKPLSEESLRLDSTSSGVNSIPDELKDDELNGEDDMGSGDVMGKEKPKANLQSNGITEKQVDKLIQAQDLGESEGSADNSIPQFKEANDGSGEVLEVEGKGSKAKDQEFANTLESTKAQVFTDTTGAAQPGTQPYNYATATPAIQPEGQYSDAQPAQQTAAAAQPAAQTYADAAAQAPAAQPSVQYYSDATAPAAQPAPPQADAEKIPAPIDVAMEATHPGEQGSYYAPNNPASQPSQVLNDANGVPQPIDAAAMVTNPAQTQYYNNQAVQQASQQTVANAQASTLVADNSGAVQQLDTATAAAQQPMQYTSQTSMPQQDASNSNQNDQAYPASLSAEDKMRKMDASDENKFRTVVCQNNQDTISCPQGKNINIIDAHYGSMGMSSCQELQSSFLPMQPCETPGAYQTVKTSCDDVENCVLSANDGIFGDQCQSDRKYLDVTYKCDKNEEPAQAQQYYYPGAQPAATPAYSPYYQGSPYGYQQQQQEQQYNDEPEFTPPPPPKMPELMSTLVQISKNRQRYGDQPATCSSCNKCSQCYKSALCAQCDFCKNKLCDEAAALPVIPKNLRPLWELWNERTADMNSMEMSALILSPLPKKHHIKVKKVVGSSSKRSHIKKPKTAQTAKKSTKHAVKILKKNSKKQ